MNDLLPEPATGHRLPQYDHAANQRAIAADQAFDPIFLPVPRQTAIMARIEALRAATVNRRGTPLPGLRLSQQSQAGKTTSLLRYKQDLENRMINAGAPENPYRVLYILLRRRITVKMLYQRILIELNDKHFAVGNLELLISRVEEFLLNFKVELLIVDEVQHLANTRSDSSQVTDELKSFLDGGLVPIVFAGNEESLNFFEQNSQLSARLGSPLELSPVDPKVTSDKIAFKSFCVQLDEAIHRTGATRQLSQFANRVVLDGLLKAATGHIGRVSRIVRAALDNAARRDADFIELHDLAVAVNQVALPNKWVFHNPFLKS